MLLDRFMRRRGWPSTLALLVICVFGTGMAAAQLPPGASGSSSLEIVDDEEAFRALSAFGACFASRKTDEALALIATVPGTRGEAETSRRRIRRPAIVCLGGNSQFRMPMYMMRGAIAEGLYRRGVALPPDLALAAPPPGAPTRTLAEAARCYTAGHRDEVRALIDQTRIGSREEYERLREMAPAFFTCLPERARGGQVIAAQVRGHLAEALYRMPTPAGN